MSHCFCGIAILGYLVGVICSSSDSMVLLFAVQHMLTSSVVEMELALQRAVVSNRKTAASGMLMCIPVTHQCVR